VRVSFAYHTSIISHPLLWFMMWTTRDRRFLKLTKPNSFSMLTDHRSLYSRLLYSRIFHALSATETKQKKFCSPARDGAQHVPFFSIAFLVSHFISALLVSDVQAACHYTWLPRAFSKLRITLVLKLYETKYDQC
jgi:hypothetical protein